MALAAKLLTELVGFLLFMTVIALVLVVLNVAVTRATQGNSFYGLVIGFTVAAGAFTVGPISGGAFNPAAGFGATLAASIWGGGGWADLWLYFAGPLIGAALGAGVHWLQAQGVEDAVAPPEGPPAPGAPAPVPAAAE